MAIVVSYTCLRDLELLKRLNHYLTSKGIEHWAFFEQREMLQAEWEYEGIKFERDNGGDNGMGRDGANAKVKMLKKAYEIAESLNMLPCTFIDCDSDVQFNNDKVINDLVCADNEFKGFSGFDLNNLKPEPPTHKVFGDKWYYATGCLKSFHSTLLKKLIDSDWANYMPDLINHNITPSEDAFLSYAFQVPLQGKFINMKEKYTIATQCKDYDNNLYDIMS